MASNYEQLVKALRCKSLSKECDSCKYGYRLCPDSECNDACHVEQIIDDAAAAIEELQDKVFELEEELNDADVAADDNGRQIEELQAEIRESMQKCAECGDANMPKRGKWILCGPVGWPKWKCSVCYSEGRGDYIRCPWCGAVMDESNASNALNALDNAQDGPIITPCRGCSDYDGYGGCKSKGGCARKLMEVQDGQ